jgi:hypothetical protein
MATRSISLPTNLTSLSEGKLKELATTLEEKILNDDWKDKEERRFVAAWLYQRCPCRIPDCAVLGMKCMWCEDTTGNRSVVRITCPEFLRNARSYKP